MYKQPGFLSVSPVGENSQNNQKLLRKILLRSDSLWDLAEERGNIVMEVDLTVTSEAANIVRGTTASTKTLI